MDPDRWVSVERILRSVLALDPSERRSAIERACGGDQELRREVESLLAQEPSADFLEGIAGDLPIPEAEPLSGWRAGPYRIVRLLASGGMGSVWLAERDDDEYRKQVAIKVIKVGLDAQDVLQRFRLERQVQANLEHPNIVRLLDGGATDDGRPYLVMEYVEGKPILAHCKERGLSIPERLVLFRKVCGAVQYAHQNLVVHRDLKPGNILVTPDGEPKLLDFGIAKVLSPGEDPNEADLTSTSLRPMTLRYASPEQIRGEVVTTATDVYSLGVILCEVLAGRGPYDVASGSQSDYERAVRDRDPLPPSEAAAQSDLPRTQNVLRGDLDAIVLKALRKEPRHRYQSVEQLSEDVLRHLDGFPVLARRGTAWYRSARFLRRHAPASAFLAAILLSLVGGIVATLRQADVAERARNTAIEASKREHEAAEAARRAARRAQRITHFLQEVLAAASPRKQGRDITAEQALDRAAARVGEDFGDDPEVESAIHATVGETYMALGRYADAERHLGDAVAILDAAGVGETGDLASSLIGAGTVAFVMGKHEEARKLTERGLGVSERVLGPGHAEVARCLNNLGVIAKAQGDLGRAEELLQRALVLRRTIFGEEHVTAAESLNNLHGVLKMRGDLAAAETVARQVLAMRRRLLGDRHPDTVQSIDNLAVTLAVRKDYRAAEPLTREAVAGYENLVGPNHPDLAIALKNRSVVLSALNDHAGAEACLDRAWRIRRVSLAPDDARTFNTARLLAESQMALRKFEQAEETLEYARADAETALEPDHPVLRGVLEDLVRLYETWDKPERVAGLRARLQSPSSSRVTRIEQPASR